MSRVMLMMLDQCVRACSDGHAGRWQVRQTQRRAYVALGVCAGVGKNRIPTRPGLAPPSGASSCCWCETREEDPAPSP